MMMMMAMMLQTFLVNDETDDDGARHPHHQSHPHPSALVWKLLMPHHINICYSLSL